jgi:ABC-type dipeptide/oligopeptide/nickel transport system ATPase component
MIAMAIATGPKLLIADEPTTALDKETEEKILQLLVKLRKDLSLSILLITHNICLVRRIADITAVMYNGRIIEVEQTNKLFQNPRHPYTKTLLESLPQLIKS